MLIYSSCCSSTIVVAVGVNMFGPSVECGCRAFRRAAPSTAKHQHINRSFVSGTPSCSRSGALIATSQGPSIWTTGSFNQAPRSSSAAWLTSRLERNLFYSVEQRPVSGGGDENKCACSYLVPPRPFITTISYVAPDEGSTNRTVLFNNSRSASAFFGRGHESRIFLSGQCNG